MRRKPAKGRPPVQRAGHAGDERAGAERREQAVASWTHRERRRGADAQRPRGDGMVDVDHECRRDRRHHDPPAGARDQRGGDRGSDQRVLHRVAVDAQA